MATVAVRAPSDLDFKKAMKTVESWAPQAAPTEQQKLEFLEQAIKDLSQPGNIEIFKSAMKELGIRAVKTDEAFARIKKTMDNFATKYKDRFPGIVEYQQEWNGYNSTWKSHITTSRDLATKSASEYEIYSAYLETFREIDSKEDMNKLASNMKEFAKNKPVDIPVDLKDKFIELRGNVLDFQKRFNKYLDDQQVALDQKAERLTNEINGLKEEIKGLDQRIKDATLGLEIAVAFGPIAAAIAGTALSIIAIVRAARQGVLDDKIAELKEVEASQKALGEIKTQFAGVIPDFELITENLHLLADTWNSFHNQAVDFATKFEALERPNQLSLLYKRKVDLALGVSIPLTKGLRAYAAAIHS